MGLLPEWWQKGERPMGNNGQYTQSNMFTNPVYEQQSRMGRMAQMLRQPQQNMQQPMQQPMQNPMQPQSPMQQQPNQAGPQNQQLLNQNPNMNNWGSQYGGQ
jgi:hypothetical protein